MVIETLINNFLIYLIPVTVVSALLAALTTKAIKKFATNNKIGVYPNERMIHTGFIPRLGGIGIVSGFFICLGMALFFSPYRLNDQYVMILIGAVIITGLGIYDDFRGINAPRKLFIQLFITILLVYSGFNISILSVPLGPEIKLGVLAIPFTFLWIISITNAINLIDGLDGLAAGIGIIASCVFLIASAISGNMIIVFFCLALIAGLTGFLKYNYHPASIFMGDTGSLFLGFVLSAISIKTFESSPGKISIILPLLALAIPLGDTVIAFFRRLHSGNHPFKPDKDHLHHRLIYLGLSHKQAVNIIYFLAFIFSGTTLLLITDTLVIGYMVLLIALVFSFLGLKRLGYLEARKFKTMYGDEKLFKIEKELAPLSMRRFLNRFIFSVVDIISINAALGLFIWLRMYYGFINNPGGTVFDPAVLFLISGAWLLLFFLTDLYNMRWDISRFDQVRRVSKTIIFGVLILFIITWDNSNLISQGRLSVLIYGLFLIIFVNGGRLLLIFLEKSFNILGYAPQTTLLVGATDKARKILKDIRKNEHLLYNIIGFVTKESNKKTFSDLEYLGSYDNIPDIIRSYGVQELIFALNEKSRDELLKIVASIINMKVVLKIIPEFYDIVSGHKTEEVIGHPLIRLFPDHMKNWQWISKRLIDIFVSALLFIVTLPIGLLFYGLLLIESPSKKAFIITDIVGKERHVFGMLNYNVKKGQKGIHRVLYRSNLYKFPVLLNIIMGKMSIVGPRPETPDEVNNIKNKIRFYNRRFQIRPGLTGWAQIKYRYDDSLKSQREQYKQDLFYLENMSLSLDLRIILRSVYILIFKR